MNKKLNATYLVTMYYVHCQCWIQEKTPWKNNEGFSPASEGSFQVKDDLERPSEAVKSSMSFQGVFYDVIEGQ